MSMKAVAIRTMSFGGIFLSSRPSVNRSPAPMSTRTTRTIGDAMVCATPSCIVSAIGLPSAAGGTARPTTPASATIVST